MTNMEGSAVQPRGVVLYDRSFDTYPIERTRLDVACSNDTGGAYRVLVCKRKTVPRRIQLPLPTFAMQTRLILGGPGCGKTTFQLAQVDVALQAGTPPDRIAFVSFTKTAVEEARARACDQFDLEPRDLPYFRTIHSLCFRALGLRRSDVMQPDDWKRIADAAAVEFTIDAPVHVDDDMPGDGATEGDRALSLIQYAQAVRSPLKPVWQEYGGDLAWHMVERLEGTIAAYKGSCERLDFPDMLTQYFAHGAPIPLDLAVIDEAQDLTAAQWAVVRRAFSSAREVLISGDDDQAIHTWAGAATRMFLSINAPRTVLPVSHRLPRPIWEQGNAIAARISQRFTKEWAPASHKGMLSSVQDLDDVPIGADGSWMIIARNGYMLRDIAKHLRHIGLPYRTRTRSSIDLSHVRGIVCWERQRKGTATEQEQETAREYADRSAPVTAPWFDALTGIALGQREYYRTILRAGHRLQDESRILISTIHGVKGMEADNVVLLTDVTRKIRDHMDRDPDPELRVFYVGATRARRNLYIVEPRDAVLGVTL
jgi:DNA helicase II / ATP-dependent DNA helicase PcrA